MPYNYPKLIIFRRNGIFTNTRIANNRKGTIVDGANLPSTTG